MRKLLVLLGVVVASVGVVATAAPAVPPTCGAVITQSTTLTADLLGCPGDGLIIAGSRMTIDLAGHTLGAAPGNGGVGVRIAGNREDVKIINGSIAGFDTGISVSDALRVTVRDVTVTGPETGIRFERVVHSYIRNSVVVTNILLIELIDSDTNEISFTVGLGDADNHAGVRMKAGSDGNVLRDSSFRRSNGPNVVLLDSDDNRVEDSDLGGSNTVGVQLIRSDRNRVRRNLTDSEAASVNVAVSTGNQVHDNDGGDSSLEVVESTDTLVRNNVAGFLSVRRSAGTTAVGNVLTEDRADGLIVDPLSTGTRLIRNRAFGYDDDGIDVDAPGTYLEENRATGNGDLGIEAVAGVVDGGANRASGNGNPLQCTGVVCTP